MTVLFCLVKVVRTCTYTNIVWQVHNYYTCMPFHTSNYGQHLVLHEQLFYTNADLYCTSCPGGLSISSVLAMHNEIGARVK